jgi:hypothetical protein
MHQFSLVFSLSQRERDLFGVSLALSCVIRLKGNSKNSDFVIPAQAGIQRV